jgi:hypothetical protein
MEKMHTFFGNDYSSCLIVRYDEERNVLTCYFHFKKTSFWRRVKIALTYIFTPGKFPDMDDLCFVVFTLQPHDKTRMINLVRKLKDDR